MSKVYNISIDESTFRTLIVDSLNVFTHSSRKELDQRIHELINRIRVLLDIDTCGFYALDEDKEKMSMVYTDNAGSFHTYLRNENFQNVPLNKLPVLVHRMLNGRPVVIRSTLDIKPYSEYFKNIWNELTIKALLVLPIRVKDKTFGFFTFANHRHEIDWQQNTITRLQILSNIFANTLNRFYKESYSEKTNKELLRVKNLLNDENKYLKGKISKVDDDIFIYGKSVARQNLQKQLKTIAPTEHAVLLKGEIGSGKESIARYIHQSSDGSNQPFIFLNAVTVTETGFEDYLHQLHDFISSAWIEINDIKAPCATLYINNIDKLKIRDQQKFLSFYKRVNKAPSNFRIIGATTIDLMESVERGSFLSELFFQLNFVIINIPPLRSHKEDIPEIVKRLIDQISSKREFDQLRILPSTLERLTAHSWPFNLRELISVIERAVLTSEDNTLHLGNWFDEEEEEGDATKLISLQCVLKRHIMDVLHQTGGKIEGKGGASEILDLHPSTLRSKMKKLEIQR